MSQGTSGRQRAVFWILFLSIPTVLLTAYLLASGEKGVWIATILTVPLGIYAILVPLVLALRQDGPPAPALSLRTKALIGATVLVVGAILPGAMWWGVRTYADVEVDLGGSFRLEQGRPVTIAAKAETGNWRGNLVFVPRLSNTDRLGDCVHLREPLRITAIADGKHHAVKMVGNDARVSIPIADGTRDVQLVVEFVDPSNQGCVVDATLSGATLER